MKNQIPNTHMEIIIRPKFIFATIVGLMYLTAVSTVDAYSLATKTDFASVVAAEDHLDRNRSIENDYASRTRDLEQQFAERYTERSAVDRRAERLSAREAVQEWQRTEDDVLVDTSQFQRPAAPEVQPMVTHHTESEDEQLHAGAQLIQHGFSPPPFLPSSGFGMSLLVTGVAGVALQRTRARRKA